MRYMRRYVSPAGNMILSADDMGLTELSFESEKHLEDCVYAKEENHILDMTEKWLDIYFSGNEPDFLPPMHITGTKFQKEVWKILSDIPYGETITYGEIADVIAKRRNIKKMSAQAVGGAVGRNPIAVIIPCHRVMGKDGNFTGYAGGLNKKYFLLKTEGAVRGNFYMPVKNRELN